MLLLPEKVMQTAVGGSKGILTYHLNLDGFPGFRWAFTYFAEIEDLGPNDTRKFRLSLPANKDVSKLIVNIQENGLGKYRLYEPGFTNLSLPFVLSFAFVKTPDSTEGPLVNAIEINNYLKKSQSSLDGNAIASVMLLYSSADWAQEGGDPCRPAPWSWVRCTDRYFGEETLSHLQTISDIQHSASRQHRPQGCGRSFPASNGH